jgi:WD40 repeat protein
MSVFLAFSLPLGLCAAGPAQVLRRPGTEAPAKVEALAFSPDGKVLAVGSSAAALRPGTLPGDQPLPEGTIELWDLKSGRLLTTLRQNARTDNSDSANRVGALAFSPDGRWLVGGDGPGYTLWEMATAKQQSKWRKGIVFEPLSPAWSPDGRWIALPTMLQPDLAPYEVGPTGVGVVDAATGKPEHFVPIEVGYARTARISPDGKLLATAGHDCTVRVFDLGAMTNVFSEFVQTTMFVVSFSPDGRSLVAGPSWGGALLIYEVGWQDGRVVIKKRANSKGTAGELHSFEFAADGKRALSNSSEGVQLWDASRWVITKNLGLGCGCFSPNVAQVALAREATPGQVEIWAFGDLVKAP